METSGNQILYIVFIVPFSWIGFNCHKATDPLQGDSLHFTPNTPGVPGTHLINLRKIKG